MISFSFQLIPGLLLVLPRNYNFSYIFVSAWRREMIFTSWLVQHLQLKLFSSLRHSGLAPTFHVTLLLSCDSIMCFLHPVRHMILCPIIDPTISQPAELRVIPGSGWLKMAVSSLPDSQMHFKSPLSYLFWCFPAITVAGAVASVYNVGKRLVASLKISPWICNVQCAQYKASAAWCIMWNENNFKFLYGR